MNKDKIKKDFLAWWDSEICQNGIKQQVLKDFQEPGYIIAGEDISFELKNYGIEFMASYSEPTFENNRWLIECRICDLSEDAGELEYELAYGESEEGCIMAFFNALEELK